MEQYVLTKIKQTGLIGLRPLLSAVQTDKQSPFDKRTVHRDLISVLLALHSSKQISWEKDGISC